MREEVLGIERTGAELDNKKVFMAGCDVVSVLYCVDVERWWPGFLLCNRALWRCRAYSVCVWLLLLLLQLCGVIICSGGGSPQHCGGVGGDGTPQHCGVEW